MKKTVKITEEKIYCDVCKEELANYQTEKELNYDFCYSHKELVTIAKKLSDMKIEAINLDALVAEVKKEDTQAILDRLVLMAKKTKS